jgi:hypothetical protein
LTAGFLAGAGFLTGFFCGSAFLDGFFAGGLCAVLLELAFRAGAAPRFGAAFAGRLADFGVAFFPDLLGLIYR